MTIIKLSFLVEKISKKGAIMITKEVNDWIKKVETKNYSSWDIMEEFTTLSKHLTKEELNQIKNRLANTTKIKR